MADPQKTDPRSGNHPGMLPGEVIKHASGWKAREAMAEKRLRKRTDADERAAIRAARAAHYAGAEAAPVATQAETVKREPVGDAIAAMGWEDLKALYELKLGEKPGNRMKRVEVEAAIRDAGGEELM